VVRIRIGGEEVTLSWEEWEHRVRTGQIGEQTEVQFEPVTGVSWVPAGDLEMFHSLKESAVLAFQGAGTAPIITALLIGLNIRVWWAQWWVIPLYHGVLSKCTAAHSPIMEDGEGWRLLTMGLCHNDLGHIASNMLWLGMAGWGIERALGRINLVAIFVGSVLGGSLLTIILDPGTPSLGASGGVFGCVAAVVVFGFFRPHLLPENRRGLYGVAMLPYLVIMFGLGWLNESVANWAHFGGLLSGGALAMVLDPAPLQRRPLWNAGWQSLVAAAVVLCIVAPLVAGPRIHMLIDAKTARIEQTRVVVTKNDDKPEPYRSLVYRVPAGWAPKVNSAGDSAFLSRVWNVNRSWSVSTRTESRPASPELVLERWKGRLERGWDDAVWSEPEPRNVAGWEGLAASVHIGKGEDGRTLEWWATTRGLHTLQVVWEVDDASAARLRPLRDRLYANIEWKEPDDLRDANREYTHRSESRNARKMLAKAVARVGDSEQSIELWLGLIGDEPTKRDYWDGLLETLEWYPDHPQADALWARALSERPTPRTAGAVAKGLDAAGRTSEADGLIDLAWAHDPGDRMLKRIRRGRDQSTALDAETNLPWELANDPVDGSRRVTPELPELLTLENARARGRDLEARAVRVEESAIAWIEDGDAQGPPISLLFLRFGETPAELPEAYEALIRDLGRLENATPSWLPEPIAEVMRAQPDLEDRLDTLSKEN